MLDCVLLADPAHSAHSAEGAAESHIRPPPPQTTVGNSAFGPPSNKPLNPSEARTRTSSSSPRSGLVSSTSTTSTSMPSVPTPLPSPALHLVGEMGSLEILQVRHKRKKDTYNLY